MGRRYILSRVRVAEYARPPAAGERCGRRAACCRGGGRRRARPACPAPVDQEQHVPGAEQRRVGQRQPARRQRGNVDRDRQAIFDRQRRRARETARRCGRRGPARAARGRARGASRAPQRLLVVARGGVEIGGLGLPAEHVRLRNARRVEQRLARHAVVRLRIVGRDRAFVAEEDVGARPVDAVDQPGIERARRRAARQRDAKPPPRRDGVGGEARCAPRPARPARRRRRRRRASGRATAGPSRGTLPRAARSCRGTPVVS